MVALFLRIPLIYTPAYFLFFSALIVTIRTDIETFLISRFVSLFIIPLGISLSYFNALQISVFDSIIGAIVGYLFPYIFSKIFQWITDREGMGTGDFELLAFIGSFTGLAGSWMSLVMGSLIGSLYGISQFIMGRADRATKIPFGPFLALGAIIFVLYRDYILKTLLKVL